MPATSRAHPGAIADVLHAAIACTVGRDAATAPLTVSEVGGGSIARSFIVGGTSQRCFVKLDRADAATFAAEADGLEALRRCAQLRVPEVFGYGVVEDCAYLVLEYLELKPLHGNAATAGRALAALHRCTGERFGWPRDNFIGRTPQQNAEDDDWPRFFARYRLAPQLELARRKGLRVPGADRLLDALPTFFADYRPPPSLIHGDLWHGNAALDAHGTLALFDPAVHYADRECDLAMAALFGGFSAGFFTAYHDAWPLADGHAERRTLYQLYHVLNHANLFGGSYGAEAAALIGRLLAANGR